MTVVPVVALNNGVEIPQLGFGVFQIGARQTKAAVLTALDVGYRHIDTAQSYRNEKQVGAAVRDSGLPRAEIFVTSKLRNGAHAAADALRAFEQTLTDLDLGYLDLFLIHWPMPRAGDYVETWHAMREMLGSGRVRAIGVSNFKPAHLRRLLEVSSIVPAVNQIELHPYLSQDETRTFDAARGIATQGWSPLAQGRVVGDATIGAIAARLGRTPAQVTLRWHLQRGDIVIPKSVTPARMEENFAVFDFELGGADMAAIAGLNRDERIGPDPDAFNWAPRR